MYTVYVPKGSNKQPPRWVGATFEDIQRSMRKVAPRRNEQLSTETCILFGYLRFLPWFYSHDIMMCCEINLEETSIPLKFCLCGWPGHFCLFLSVSSVGATPAHRALDSLWQQYFQNASSDLNSLIFIWPSKSKSERLRRRRVFFANQVPIIILIFHWLVKTVLADEKIQPSPWSRQK